MDNQTKEQPKTDRLHLGALILVLKDDDLRPLFIEHNKDLIKQLKELIPSPDKPVPEQEDKWDGKCLICLIRKLGYKIRIDNFKHTCSLKDYDS